MVDLCSGISHSPSSKFLVPLGTILLFFTPTSLLLLRPIMHLSLYNCPKDISDELLSPSRTIALDPVEEMCFESGSWPCFVAAMVVLLGSWTEGPFFVITFDNRDASSSLQ